MVIVYFYKFNDFLIVIIFIMDVKGVMVLYIVWWFGSWKGNKNLV